MTEGMLREMDPIVLYDWLVAAAFDLQRLDGYESSRVQVIRELAEEQARR